VKRERGASLVEVLVALAVFAIGVGAFLPLLATSNRAGRAATARTEALARAKEKVDELQTLPFPAAASLGTGQEPLGGGLTREWTPLPPPADGGDLARYLVTVRWNLSGTSGAVALVGSRGRY
jgi:prepilin-type N-terminal cleavage/methylation domain-containing protein